ncbi:MAG: polyphenol oxidase family protein [Holophaga sp.]|nr:polyphenol oxidase family protein [Holophaga sp.]
MIAPSVPPPFPLQWGFTTRLDSPNSAPPIRLKQIHGCEIHPANDEVQLGDGLWTTTPGEAIGVRVADCAPILLAGLAANTPWVAALHAGWRGAVAAILRRGVRQFEEQGGHPKDLVWAIGPAIGRCHFEVGVEVIEAAREDSTWRDDLATESPSGKFFFDLHGFLRAQALDLGLDMRKDGSINRCTRCEPELFFSYRGGDTEGRQWGWVQIGEKN